MKVMKMIVGAEQPKKEQLKQLETVINDVVLQEVINKTPLTKESINKYRRHAIVAILVVAAIITPADPFSMLIAAAPLYLLYEMSILVCVKKD